MAWEHTQAKAHLAKPLTACSTRSRPTCRCCLLIDTPDGGIGFRPGDHFTIEDAGNGFVKIQVPPAVLAEMTAVLRPVAGTYRLAGAELAVQIVKSQIRDQDGAVVAEIG